MKELNEARVLAVGPGGLDKEGKRVGCSVKAGDKVLIPQVRANGEGDERRIGGMWIGAGERRAVRMMDGEYLGRERGDGERGGWGEGKGIDGIWERSGC